MLVGTGSRSSTRRSTSCSRPAASRPETPWPNVVPPLPGPATAAASRRPRGPGPCDPRRSSRARGGDHRRRRAASVSARCDRLRSRRGQHRAPAARRSQLARTTRRRSRRARSAGLGRRSRGRDRTRTHRERHRVGRDPILSAPRHRSRRRHRTGDRPSATRSLRRRPHQLHQTTAGKVTGGVTAFWAAPGPAREDPQQSAGQSSARVAPESMRLAAKAPLRLPGSSVPMSSPQTWSAPVACTTTVGSGPNTRPVWS